MKKIEIKRVGVYKVAEYFEIEAEDLDSAIEKVEDNPVQWVGLYPDEMDRVVCQQGEDSGLICIDEDEFNAMEVTKAKEVLKKAGYFSCGFSIMDIMSEEREDITEEDALQIAETIERTSDANIGINWDTIESEVDSFREGRHNDIRRTMNNPIGNSFDQTYTDYKGKGKFEKFLTGCVEYIGLGFHVDTPFADYQEDGKPLFTEEQARHLDFLMDYYRDRRITFDTYAFVMNLPTFKNS